MKLILIPFFYFLGLCSSFAVTLTATSVTENFVPPLNLNFSCNASVTVTSDGSTVGTNGYCPQSSVPSNYEITYTFSPGALRLTHLTVFANAGGIYTDGELQSFDLEIDYIDDTGSPATLVRPNINIGNTLNVNDPRRVFFLFGGIPRHLEGVSEVRISNLGGTTPEFAFREISGNFETTSNQLQTVKSIVGGSSFPAVGDDVTFEVEVSNFGIDEANGITLTDLLPAGLTPTAGNGSATTGSYNSGSGVWTITSLLPGDSATLTIEGTVNAGQQANTITNATTAADNIANDETDTVGDILSQSTIVADPNFTITKVASPDANLPVGAVVTYRYQIRNTGNVPLGNISLSDIHNGLGSFNQPSNETILTDVAPTGDSSDAVTNDGIWTNLAPGDQIEFTTTYTIVQADIDQRQ